MKRVPLPLGEGGAKRRVKVASLCKSCDPHPALSQRERVDLPATGICSHLHKSDATIYHSSRRTDLKTSGPRHEMAPVVVSRDPSFLKAFAYKMGPACAAP